MVRPGARKRAVHWVVKEFGVSERRACRVFGLHRSTKRYVSRRTEPPELRDALRGVAYAHPRFGYRRVLCGAVAARREAQGNQQSDRVRESSDHGTALTSNTDGCACRNCAERGSDYAGGIGQARSGSREQGAHQVNHQGGEPDQAREKRQRLRRRRGCEEAQGPTGGFRVCIAAETGLECNGRV